MNLYAHWLDGEYLKVAERLIKPGSPPMALSLNRAIKLHALFGNQLALSRVQIIDSGFILDIFSDPEFRGFLKNYPSFFNLVAEFKSQGPRRFSIATSGIHNSLVPGWVSSAFGDSRPVIELGQAVLEAQMLDPSAQLAEDAPGTIGHIVKSKWPQHKKLLEGMLWAIAHFASESTNAPVREPLTTVRNQSFYKVLESIRGDSRLFSKYEKYIEQTLNYITAHVEDETARHRRSVVYNTLDTVRWPKEHQVVWHTVIHAWNCAVQDSLEAQGGSLGELPFSTPIGVYLNRPTDALVPIKIEGNRVVQAPFSRKTFISFLNWDPATLRWNEIREALDMTSKTREGFQAALKVRNDPSEIHEAVEDHVNALAQCFEKPVLPDIPGLLWWIAAGVATLVGGPIPGGIIITGREVYEDISDALRRGYRYKVANTLKESTDKIIPATKT